MPDYKLNPNFRLMSCQHEEWTGQQDEHFFFEDLIPEDFGPAWDIVDAIGFVTWGQNEKHILCQDITLHSEKLGLITDREIAHSPTLAAAMISMLRLFGNPNIYAGEKLERLFHLPQDKRRRYEFLLRPNALLCAVGPEYTNFTEFVHGKSILIVNGGSGSGSGHTQFAQARACFDDWEILKKLFLDIYPKSGKAASAYWPELGMDNFFF